MGGAAGRSTSSTAHAIANADHPSGRDAARSDRRRDRDAMLLIGIGHAPMAGMDMQPAR